MCDNLRHIIVGRFKDWRLNMQLDGLVKAQHGIISRSALNVDDPAPDSARAASPQHLTPDSHVVKPADSE